MRNVRAKMKTKNKNSHAKRTLQDDEQRKMRNASCEMSIKTRKRSNAKRTLQQSK